MLATSKTNLKWIFSITCAADKTKCLTDGRRNSFRLYWYSFKWVGRSNFNGAFQFSLRNCAKKSITNILWVYIEDTATSVKYELLKDIRIKIEMEFFNSQYICLYIRMRVLLFLKYYDIKIWNTNWHSPS